MPGSPQIDTIPDARKSDVPESCDARYITRVHFPYGLKYMARYLPGGIKTMIYLAWLSRDEKVRTIAALWNRLPRQVKVDLELEELCRSAGLSWREFDKATWVTARELGIGNSQLLRGALEMSELLEVSIDAIIAGHSRGRHIEEY